MGVRTPDPLLAKQVLSQLSYRPVTISNGSAEQKSADRSPRRNCVATISPFAERCFVVVVDGGRTWTRTRDLHLIRMAL
jgi:hypothetical protein